MANGHVTGMRHRHKPDPKSNLLMENSVNTGANSVDPDKVANMKIPWSLLNK